MQAWCFCQEPDRGLYICRPRDRASLLVSRRDPRVALGGFRQELLSRHYGSNWSAFCLQFSCNLCAILAPSLSQVRPQSICNFVFSAKNTPCNFENWPLQFAKRGLQFCSNLEIFACNFACNLCAILNLGRCNLSFSGGN